MQPLSGQTALVTGGSRGIGKGVALELLGAGARAYVTGRSADDLRYLADRGTALVCDHRVDAEVEAAFRAILQQVDHLDLLVNNVWGGYEDMVEKGVFTWSKPFWEQPRWRWDAMFAAGVRAHYVASQLAAPGMIAHGRGLIVNISFWAAQKYVGNVAYGVSKAATDKLTVDMAHELRPHGVTVVSLYPGLVRTEKVMEAAAWLDLSNSESPSFIGRTIAALATDPEVFRHSGKTLIAAAVAEEYGVRDVDGKQPRPLTLHDV
ncbi:MAG TPA: SDR family NAD(P)-dependent oxidoreductase [Gemmatimonadaceae bacterium]|nr:SDR family NAD(P)-dependent oxidoreductase [Gemmatimonadaceae bacterium]